jgi:hypothetical protein
MKKISRSVFLKQTGTMLALGAIAHSYFHHAAASPFNTDASDLFAKLVSANDAQVELLLKKTSKDNFSRRIGSDLAKLASSYCTSSSKYFQHGAVLPAMNSIADVLLAAQSEDGTVSIGNLESPPDTAFLLELVTAATWILKEHAAPATEGLLAKLKQFIVRAAEALKTGGVHTPNHRWVISTALARINKLYPNKSYVDRIDEWLSEGIYQDADGHYAERSMIYSRVEDEAYMTMARLLDRPKLYDYVSKNLELTYYYMEPNGDLVTFASRRQDQYLHEDIMLYYLQYRYMAIKTNNPLFAAITSFIEQMDGFDTHVLQRDLFHFLENPLLQKELPKFGPLPAQYEKLIPTTQLLRIRRDATTITLFGGTDLPTTIASGRSNSPNCFIYRKGKAHLQYLRLSSSFFSMGYFYSDGLRKDGSKYVLYRKLEVPYYQPLPKDKKKADGDYTLSPSIDDRFWNKMDFSNRPVSNVKTLETKLVLSENNGEATLQFSVTGMPGVNVTIELCFGEEGQLSGVVPVANGNNDWLLEQGEGTYQLGNDTISFGPGAVKAKTIANLDGERYTTHFGTLRTKGKHVYLTGVTPFEHTLYFK